MTDKGIKQRCKWIESHMKKIRTHYESLKGSKNPKAQEVAYWIEENQLVNYADATEIPNKILDK